MEAYQMAEATPRVGRPRTRAEGPGDYVGFRSPRELKERLEAAAARSGRSLSTEAQIRLEKSFEKQDLLGGALELAYGPRLAGILMLLAEMTCQVGRMAGFTSGESGEAMDNWLDDAFAYDQAVTAASTILDAFRPPGDRHLLQKNGKDAREEIPIVAMPASRAADVLVALRDPQGLEQRIKESSSAPLVSRIWASMKLDPELEEKLRRLLGPLIERIRYTTAGVRENA
jgi:TraY domain